MGKVKKRPKAAKAPKPAVVGEVLTLAEAAAFVTAVAAAGAVIALLLPWLLGAGTTRPAEIAVRIDHESDVGASDR